MPRVNVYLPEDLATAVKAADLEVSTVCQNALREAVEMKERGVSTQIDLLNTAMRLRRGTPEGQREMGAADGQRWVRESATVRDLREIDLVRIKPLPGDDKDDEVFYDASWADRPEAGSSSDLETGGFETLWKWLHDATFNEGRATVEEFGDTSVGPVNEYLAGFVEAAQATWRQLRPLVDEGEVALARKIELLTGMERNMLLREAAPSSDDIAGTNDAPEDAPEDS